jgi:hypothetical protein
MPRPINAGKRYIVLQPTNMQNAEVDVWVNGELVTPSELDDPKKQLFKYRCDSEFNGGIRVKISVKKGTVLIDQNDAIGVYPCVYNNEPGMENYVGLVPFPQIMNVLWFFNPSQEVNVDNNLIRIEEGQVLEYTHLIPNGPEWLDIYINRDSIREKFIAEKTLSVSLLSSCFLTPNSEYFMQDANVSVEERTKNLTEKVQNV